mgnify:CR=1 FL=1
MDQNVSHALRRSADRPPPLLSIVVPMYNEEASAPELVKAVQSALAAYPQPWELVVVDDGSSDGTVRALRAAAQIAGTS